jgi:hypothetical protein
MPPPAGAPPRPPTSAEVFAEAMAVVPLVHTPSNATRALAFGQPASALLGTAARYPFSDLVYIGEDVPAFLRNPPKADRRVHVLLTAAGLARELPKDWQADVVAVAVPGNPEALLGTIRQLSAPGAVVAVAVDRPALGPVIKHLMERRWRTVIPYREYLPDSQLFLLASDRPLSRQRPVPSWTKRLSEGYLPALFRFPKDEYAALFSGSQP